MTSSNLSPAEAYAAAKARRDRYGVVDEFAATLEFGLDDFQLEACAALDAGHGVLVAAPTGAGKTIVGEFAVFLALRHGTRAFYTTPIKALSNQKYHDLARVHGHDRVGLLTGDVSINPGADVVVMTTEVLRNMLYSGSRATDDLEFVVMDEVHYLADRFRGPVWEEVILHLPQSVQMAALSATVSNAEEFGAWLDMVRGDTAVVVSEHRPVPLWQHVMLSARGARRPRLVDLYAVSDDPSGKKTPDINPELVQAMRVRQSNRPAYGRGGYRKQRPGRDRDTKPSLGHGPSRPAVIDALDADGLLPAIFFIFSRNACDDAVWQCMRAGLTLTTEDEQDEIAAFVEERCADIPLQERHMLGYHGWFDSLQRGVAAHHAGMLPLFKETVEHLFVRGLVKVVFATETLALGINMPARSVVLEKLVKWDGSAHVDLTAGEYTQLTGRAGRRGIDVEGHAIVLEHPRLDPVLLGGLASRRLYPLKSSFKPTYNMAVNLIESIGRERTRETLEMSFAQFQADRSVVGMARKTQESAAALEGYAKAMTCERGDINEYDQLRQDLKKTETAAHKERKQQQRAETTGLLAEANPGDIIVRPGIRHGGVVVVTATQLGHRTADMIVHGIDETGRHRRLSATELPSATFIHGSVRLPKNLDTKSAAGRKHAASILREEMKRRPADLRPEFRGGGKAQTRAEDRRVAALRAELRAHPCHDCPDIQDHLRWADRWHKLNREHQGQLRKIESRTGTISMMFDRIVKVLIDLKYLRTRADGEMTVAAPGLLLRRMYLENDLLMAECCRRGIWDTLSAAELAGAVSTLVYEGRRDDASGEAPPTAALDRTLDEVFRVWSELEDLEDRYRISTVRRPELGVMGPIFRWARGQSLDRALRDTDLAPGDFVRWVKQTADALRQLGMTAENGKVRQAANQAVDALERGVVAYSGVQESHA